MLMHHEAGSVGHTELDTAEPLPLLVRGTRCLPALPILIPRRQHSRLPGSARAGRKADWPQRWKQAAGTLDQRRDLPAGGRQTLIQYISYFENGRRKIADRLQPIFCEALKTTAEELGFDNSVSNCCRDR